MWVTSSCSLRGGVISPRRLASDPQYERSRPVVVFVEGAVAANGAEVPRATGQGKHLVRRWRVDEGECDGPAVAKAHNTCAVGQSVGIDKGAAAYFVADRFRALAQLVVKHDDIGGRRTRVAEVGVVVRAECDREAEGVPGRAVPLGVGACCENRALHQAGGGP